MVAQKENLVLYSSDTCPQCSQLKRMLDEKHADYTVVTDPHVLAEKGIMSIPQLENAGKIMMFPEAFRYVKECL